MSQADRSPRSITARPPDQIPAPASPAPPEADAPPVDLVAPSSHRLSARLVWRAVRRYWWQALLLWIAGTSASMTLAYYKVKPSYDAFSTIKVDPGDRGLFRENSSMVDFEVFKETQVKRVTNPNVIATALSAHPDLLHLPRLALAQDPEVEIRRSLSVMVIPKTNLIQVSMASESADEAARIVNAVIEAYLKVALDANEEETEKRCRRLREVKEERTVAVRQKRDAIAALVGRIGTVDSSQARDRNSVTIEHYKMLTNQLLQADLELVEEQARLDQLQNEPNGPAAVDPSEPDAEMIAAFYATPQVAEARARLDKAREGLAHADRVARSPEDPARIAAKKKADDCQRQIDILWTKMRPGLVRSGRSGDVREAELHTAEVKVAGLKTRLAQLNDRLEKLNIQTRTAGADELTLEFARQDLNRAEAVLDTVTRSLDQVEFEAKDPVARFRQEYKAKASNSPYANHRLKAMAAAPVGMFLGVLGLCVLVELRAGRVQDPEELPDRLRLRVLGVVPPLPRGRPAAGQLSTREQARSRRDLDQFIQSLDHLRVAICAGRDGWGQPRRSIIITSACGGEGKTTLAAQLAERCVNAGLLTLLIDADIRNPTLSRMFDLPTSRGLVNILRGEAMAEEAISVIGGAGGFHFLPAGSPRVDPSRLLHGDRLPKLLASARESFDIVIVDSPPVLPVPDALTVGRWVDGAVLAVRFDNSRYPLVERASRRLAAVGVPVIGAVVNGVRGSEGAYYGSYYPTYGSTDPDGDSALEL
jgi:capsular exopolysaccharide synthesis family protein